MQSNLQRRKRSARSGTRLRPCVVTISKSTLKLDLPTLWSLDDSLSVVIPRIGRTAATAVKSADVHGVVQTIVARGAPGIAPMVRAELKVAFDHGVSAGRFPDIRLLRR